MIRDGRIYTYKNIYVKIENVVDALKNKDSSVRTFEGTQVLGKTLLKDLFAEREVLKYFQDNFKDEYLSYSGDIGIKLQEAISKLSEKRTTSEHLGKLVSEQGELIAEIGDKFNGKDTDEAILKEIADVLNTIDVYLYSIGVNKNSLDDYRLEQIQKHLK